jgi:hypothetical protein
MRNITHEDIQSIIKLFREIDVWNDGRFHKAVSKYCDDNDLDKARINGIMDVAFADYLATNISSENAIRLRLNRELINNELIEPIPVNEPEEDDQDFDEDDDEYNEDENDSEYE